MRWPLGLLFLLLVSLAVAQGQAGGYGQGGGQGGGGGMGGGRMGSDFDGSQDGRKAKPEDDESQGLWTTKSAILTPGDRVEFKLTMRKGETLLAAATSDAFDPALAVVNAAGKVLVQNDDREEGDQSPFVVVRFPEAGSYTLRVESFKRASGGKFTLKTRSFVALDAPLGEALHQPPAKGADGMQRTIFRIAAKKGKIYDLRRVEAVRPYRYAPEPSRLIGPTGVEARDFQRIATPDGTTVFVALADGDYYVEYGSYNEATQLRTDFREVAVIAAKTSGETAFELAVGELKIVEFPVVPNLIVRTTLVGKDVAQVLSAPPGPPRAINNGDPAYGDSPGWAWFLMNRDSEDDVVRVFHGSGTARFAIRSRHTEAQTVALKNTESLPAWSVGAALKGALSIGDVRLFLIKSTKSELMKVYAASPQFQAKLDIFRLNGELANSIMDRKAHVATDDLYFPDADTFIVRLVCDGYGGSGEFTMKRDTLLPQAYAMGTAQTLSLDGVNFGLYAVELEAGKRYQLTTDQPNKGLRADLLDEDGQFLTSQAVRFDDVVVQYFVPTRSGRHRLWLRGESGTRRFKFELHVPPKISP